MEKLSANSFISQFVITGPSGAIPKTISPALKTQDMVNVQLNTGLSNVGMMKLARVVNQTSGTKLVEPNFNKHFLAAGRKLSDFFTHLNIKASDAKGETGSNHTVAHCKNITDFIGTIITSRNVSTERIIKIGIDGSKGFLKFCLGVIDRATKESPPQKRLLTDRLEKDTGAKHQMLVAVAEELPETYENVRQIWSLIQVDRVKAIVACGLKLANILCGLQAHSSSHPCSWRSIDFTNLKKAGALRTLGSFKESYKSFLSAGSILAKAKHTGNFFHPPILSGADDTLILDILPPPELHLLLGIVNHIFQKMKSVWPNAEKWPTSLNMKLSPYHGGMFEGNDCGKLLRNVDRLQQLAEAESAFQVIGFIEALRKFDAVVKSCFGSDLEDDFLEKIQQFQDSNLAIPNASVTPKINVVFHHIKDFVNRHMSPLGIYSEQVVDVAHQDFSHHWQRYKRLPFHPEYALGLKTALWTTTASTFNSLTLPKMPHFIILKFCSLF